MGRLTENQVIEKLRMAEFPPLTIKCREVEPYLPFAEYRSKYRPDTLVDVEWQGTKSQFVAEVTSLSTPKQIDQAIWQLTGYLEFLKNRQATETYYPLIAAPYISESSFWELTESGVSGIDLSGNINLLVPGKLLFSRTGQPNKYRSTDPIKNIYRGTSSMVVRVMLAESPIGGWTVNEVMRRITNLNGKVSLGTVSKVLQAMENDLLLSRSNGIKVLDRSRLIEKLRENYRKPKSGREMICTVIDQEKSLRQITENCNQNNLMVAIDEPKQYVAFPTVGAPVRVYTESIERSLDRVEFEETDRFANIHLIETAELSVYFDRRGPFSGLYYASPIQTYLDLSAGGRREQDIADQLLAVLRAANPGL